MPVAVDRDALFKELLARGLLRRQAEIVRHPGHPDQKVHGRRDPAVAVKNAAKKGLRLIADDDADAGNRRPEITEALSAAYLGTFRGLEVRPAPGATVTGGKTLVRFDIHDAGGKRVGGSERVLFVDEDGKLAVEHRILQLDPNVQGQGFAEEWNAHAVDFYRDNGVDRIELTANIDVGGYAWARSGYDFKDRAEAEKIIGRMRFIAMRDRNRYGTEIHPAIRDIADRAERIPFGEPGYPTAYEISQAGRPPGAGKADNWPGKESMLGSNWQAVRPL